ncbi:UPF0489 family protein [Roseofilum casamattae]|uniref:UPF0489 family protein n=1 Tax=Roseofilum casamattae BLCC-M143 TaxID=3022442 RepID=A0ABT7C0Z5_9CYAN|nr:UPF0489 family protein [Roseofilum casamattae]MDJ1184356.1 UPF0489 family protein [Roseofilum casamattae BLCC-M143]
MIPAFVFEEHHEAFFLWHYAIAENLMPNTDNILLHVDEHADFNAASLSQPIETLDTSNLSELYEFTYSQLNIANFIIPALYQKVFKQEYWIRHPEPDLNKTMRTLRIYSAEGEGQNILGRTLKKDEVSMKKLFKLLADPSCSLAKIQHLTVDDEFPDNQKVVLDIDLDYFSCSEVVYEGEGSIEITEKQYRAIVKNRYHFLRIFHGSTASFHEKNGRYYVNFHDYPYRDELSTRKLTVSNEEIFSRVDKLVNFLITHNIEIQFVCICRSRISGYTPAAQCKFIEKTLLEKLGRAYDMEPINIDRVLKEQGLHRKPKLVLA